ncbi:MAG: STAS domain-containing protein, partial [Actinomadura rubrobrunea]|nr:STAS domain-containing protein [Actinomadura rubrobrunea]
VLKIVRTFDPPGLRVEGELDAARHAAFSDRLARVSKGRLRTHLDLSRLRFVDLGGLSLLTRHASELPGGRVLVLDELPPEVEDVIEMVGWHRLPGLVRGRRGPREA